MTSGNYKLLNDYSDLLIKKKEAKKFNINLMNSFLGDKISKLQAFDVIVRQRSEDPFTKQYYKWLHCENHEYTPVEPGNKQLSLWFVSGYL